MIKDQKIFIVIFMVKKVKKRALKILRKIKTSRMMQKLKMKVILQNPITYKHHFQKMSAVATHVF